MSLGTVNTATKNLSPVTAAEKSARSAEMERTFLLVDALRKAGFPAMKQLQDSLPVRTAAVDGFVQAGVEGLYDEARKIVRLLRGDVQNILALNPADPASYTQASKAITTFFHELLHHQQQKFVGTPWFNALEKHYEEQIQKTRQEGKYTPADDPAKGPLGRRYAFEAFPNYAESRAEVWLTTHASVKLLIQHIKDPTELRAALQNQKESYEMLIQKKGQEFGYINEFPSPWNGHFKLPDGPLRKQIDEATGVPGSFDQAFPEAAALLQGAR